jgi:excisionase family DNA binding protein
MESMLTARQVAELLGVHENWVYEMAASGELPSYKIGGTRRFDGDEIRRWIAEHRTTQRKQSVRRRQKEPRRRSPAAKPKEDRQPRLFE